MRDHLVLETAPMDEDCVQFNDDGSHYPAMRIEAAKYRNMLEKRFESFGNISFGVKQFPYEGSSYVEVVVYFNDENDESSSQAYAVESNLPKTWDDNSAVDWQELKKECTTLDDEEDLLSIAENVGDVLEAEYFYDDILDDPFLDGIIEDHD